MIINKTALLYSKAVLFGTICIPSGCVSNGGDDNGGDDNSNHDRRQLLPVQLLVHLRFRM